MAAGVQAPVHVATPSAGKWMRERKRERESRRELEKARRRRRRRWRRRKKTFSTHSPTSFLLITTTGFKASDGLFKTRPVWLANEGE